MANLMATAFDVTWQGPFPLTSGLIAEGDKPISGSDKRGVYVLTVRDGKEQYVHWVGQAKVIILRVGQEFTNMRGLVWDILQIANQDVSWLPKTALEAWNRASGAERGNLNTPWEMHYFYRNYDSHNQCLEDWIQRTSVYYASEPPLPYRELEYVILHHFNRLRQTRAMATRCYRARGYLGAVRPVVPYMINTVGGPLGVVEGWPPQFDFRP